MTIYYTCVSINTIVQPKRVASKPTRNGIVHPMDILLATLLTCEEAKSITDEVEPAALRTELVEVLKLSTEKGCNWDANAD